MKKKIISIVIVLIILIVIGAIIAINITNEKEPIKGVNEQEILNTEKTISYNNKIKDEDFSISINNKKISNKDIAKLDIYNVKATLNTYNGEPKEHEYIAVKLTDLLSLADVNKYTKINAKAADDYETSYDKDKINDNTYFAIYDDGKISKRIFSPELESFYWIADVESITTE